MCINFSMVLQGDWTLGMISDELVVPKTIKPGKYVLSWRWVRLYGCASLFSTLTTNTTH